MDPEYDRIQMLRAFEKTREYFTKSAFMKFRAAYQVGILPLAVEQTFEKLPLSQYRECIQPPKTIDHLFKRTSHIFTKKFSSQFKENCREIDLICGDPLADDFFTSQTIVEWAQELVANTINSKLLPEVVEIYSPKESSESLGTTIVVEEYHKPLFEGNDDKSDYQLSDKRKLAKRCFQEPKVVMSRAFSHVRSALS
ncbi:unnamed protein product [Clonostachys rosea]|uniref:GED domain-containing protein n=1 Tax=Bionectria ochroleuca TaxID=29856 RepID=A0ABY6TS30_BIOOC|nr:unnamed protein product [Clonostachys rosea]